MCLAKNSFLVLPFKCMEITLCLGNVGVEEDGTEIESYICIDDWVEFTTTGQLRYWHVIKKCAVKNDFQMVSM